MDIEQKEELARWRDWSDEAISTRLVAARLAAGYPRQKDFAALFRLGATTYNSQEIKGRPAIKVVQYLFRNHRIDFNFIYHGDFLHLAPEVQAALFEALASGKRGADRAAN